MQVPSATPAQLQAPQLQQVPAPSNIPAQGPSQSLDANTVKALVSEILSSPDPKAKFDQLLAQFPELQEVMKIAQQYGNGDLRTAGINYIAATGKQAAAQMLIQQLGLQ